MSYLPISQLSFPLYVPVLPYASTCHTDNDLADL